MSVRDQERREQAAENRINEAERKADKQVGQRIMEQQRQAELRAEEIERRIEEGDVRPRALPGVREDSVESMESTKSIESASGNTSEEPGEES